MQIIPWIIVVCWVTFILYWIIASFSVKRDVRRSLFHRLWWIRITIAIVLVGWLWNKSLLGTFTHHIFKESAHGGLARLGALLTVLGVALAVWARVHLGRNWSVAPSVKEGHELVMSGPYALIRHPIYTGIILATVGSLIFNAVWIVVFIAVVAMFIYRVHAEEKLMMQQFPDQYPAYKKRTWALFPYIW